MSQVGWTPFPLITTPPVVDTNTTYTVQTAPNGDTLLIGSDGSSAVIATTQPDICATPTRTPDVASMKLLYCDASGIGAIDYLDFITLDSDGDSLTDIAEVVIYETDPLNPDSDGGGVGDKDEVDAGADPLDADDDVCFLASEVPMPDFGGNISDYCMSDNAGTGVAITDFGGNVIGYDWSNCPNTIDVPDFGANTNLKLKECA